MTIEEVLRACPLPRLESELLMAHVLGISRSAIFMNSGLTVTENAYEKFLALIERRVMHEPVAYITGKKEFYGRTFLVNPDVLIPRPSTEFLIDATKEFLHVREKRDIDADTGIVILVRPLRSCPVEQIADIGTGSGNIVVTLAREIVGYSFVAVDCSERALVVARQNAEILAPDAGIAFIEGDGAEVIATMSRPFIVVSNPPYIPSSAKLESDVVEFEPKQALFSGTDGMDVLRSIVRAAVDNPHCQGIIVECRTDQHEAVDSILA